MKYLTKIFLFVLFVFITGVNAQNQKEVDLLLQKFQQGYTDRNVEVVDNWCEEVFTDDVQIIFTGATIPGNRGWEFGMDAAKRLFKSDWERWGDLKCFWENAEIIVDNNIAHVQMAATLSKTDNIKKTYERCFSRVKEYADEIELEDRKKLEKILWDVSTVLYQTGKGKDIIWPVRVSMGIQKVEGKWKIRQCHFSYPTHGFPSVRFSNDEAIKFENKLKK